MARHAPVCTPRHAYIAAGPGRGVEVRDLGTMEYGACLALQRELHAARAEDRIDDVILLVEHPLVATLGRRGVPEDVFDPALPVFTIERGGKATLHGPGQLVIYPIVHLGEHHRDVRAWVRHLEGFVSALLLPYGISAAGRVEQPGVWTAGGKKIASIGIAIQRWVSLHGIALNVTIEPREFERLDPCGLGASVMTNMTREGVNVTMDEMRARAAALADAHFSAFA